MGFRSSSLCFMILILAFNQSQGTSAARHLGNETDLLALLDFKDKISQDPNGVLRSWNNSQHHCQWQGVTCDGKHQRVSGLNLLGQDLFGYVSSHIVGGIPFELDSLKNLEGLSFGKNNLTGEIPRSFGNLTSLRQIYLSYNNLKGPIPQELGQLTSLYSIGVDANYLSGTLPSSIYNISTLACISASSNIRQGNLPANMGLTLPNIQDFLLGGNQIEGTIPVSLANAFLLEQLELSDNMLKGQVPTNFGNLHNLQWLGIGGNILGCNSAGDLDFIASLSNCSNLQSLLFRGNNFGGKLPAFKWNSSNMLDQLDLGLNQILGEVPLWLRGLNNLYYLAMDNNFFSGPIPKFLGKFQMLQELHLAKNHFSGQIPSSLFNISTLYGLYLSSNELQGSIPPIIGNSQHLRYLDMSNNKLNGIIFTELFSLLSSLLYLNLSNNLFSGSLPGEISKMSNIYKFDISHNKFSGEVPDAIGQSSDLEYISMQDNFFHGTVPAKLASLKDIQILDMSRNNFTGQIPKDLEALLNVQFVNLSFNNLEGKVPIGGIFENASLISLAGNPPGLCGGIPELQLPSCPDESRKRRKPLPIRFISLIVALGIIFVALVSFCMSIKKHETSKLVRVVTCCSSQDYQGREFKSLIYEFMSNGDLDTWLHNRSDNTLNLLQRLNVAIDVASALNYVHNEAETPIVHCDLKPSNVLLDENLIGCVADFGLARLLQEKANNTSSSIGIRGSIGYAAPAINTGSICPNF
ncbi:uncharacterized protein [Coffea arabica]|uniref:Protein kinase domain-containing protein n=1 Tax=Coffea arabica TaxID=13443 RepID=A0ABM4V9M8_COFAR